MSPIAAVITTIAITLLLKLYNTEVVRNKVFFFVKTRLPTSVQWIPPLVLGFLTVLGQLYLNGLRGEALVLEALKSGGEFGLLAIGLWHSVKRVIPQIANIKPVAPVTPVTPEKQADPAPSAEVILLPPKNDPPSPAA